MDSQPTPYGCIYWPLYIYNVVRSDIVHAVPSDHNDIVCPNLQDDDKCGLAEAQTECALKAAQPEQCPYSSYHKYLLLTPCPSFSRVRTPAAVFNLENGGFSDDGIKSGVPSDILSVSLNYFPQSEEVGMPNNNVPLIITFTGNKCFGERKDKISPVTFFDDNSPQAFYAASEFLLWKDNEDMTAEIAFQTLVDRCSIKRLLPPKNTFKPECDYYIPVAISFFGDHRVDAVLALMIRVEGQGDEDFILQALLSLNEPIKCQRELFLHQWRGRLRSRVSDLFHDGVKPLEEDIVSAEDTDKKATPQEEAVIFGVEALQRMILVLLAEKGAKYTKDMFKKELFTPKALEEDACSSAEFDCYIQDPGIKKVYPDRCKFICEFCKQAKISIIEGLGAGKLRGALARNASAELMDIAKDDPVKARVLIRGEAGGGKGVAAEDIHAHCMLQIAGHTSKKEAVEQFCDALEKSTNEALLDDLSVVSALSAMCEEIDKEEYYKSVCKVLTNIVDLPSFLDVTNDNIFNEFLNNIVGTSWWKWTLDLDDDEKKSDGLTKSAGVIKKYIEALKKRTHISKQEVRKDAIEHAVQAFMGLIVLKIYYEHKRGDKADWSFNFFQVNCGIMGGQNSELAESIRRLFGQTDQGKAGKALPGLFQICSYVGGTLFLDEIADAPVRIQDNLLRPLEEGKVSRPGWETINENVKNIRIVAATFKDLFKLAEQYRETLPSGNPKGFRPDLLTRLTRNPPVTITPVWHHFVPSARYTPQMLRSQFCYVMVEAFAKSSLTARFWDDVYVRIKTKLDAHCMIATGHLPDEVDRRRHFASKITMRFLKALADRAATAKERSKLDSNTDSHLDRMLDYLLCDS